MKTISSVTAQVAAGQVTSEKLTEECLSKIAELNPTLNAFITVTGDEALAQARAADWNDNADRDPRDSSASDSGSDAEQGNQTR